MESVAVSEGMEVAAHEHFGLGVFAFDAGHVVAAGGGGVDVHFLI